MSPILQMPAAGVTSQTAERVGRALAVVAGTATGAPRLPFWQAEPCPAWCDDTTSGHDDTALPGDRNHWHTGDEITLSLYRAEAGINLLTGQPDVFPQTMQLYALQHYRAAAATIGLDMPLGDGHEHSLHLTVAEARALRDGLAAILTAVEAVAR